MHREARDLVSSDSAGAEALQARSGVQARQNLQRREEEKDWLWIAYFGSSGL